LKFKIARKTTTENRKMKRLKIRSPDLNHYSKNESESGKNGGKKNKQYDLFCFSYVSTFLYYSIQEHQQVHGRKQ